MGMEERYASISALTNNKYTREHESQCILEQRKHNYALQWELIYAVPTIL